MARAGEAAAEAEKWEPVAESVVQRLSEAILGGELFQGAKISEPEVARRFGISRAPLREAIRELEKRSLVTRLPRLGARVVELSPERIDQVFVAREALEGMAARQAALHITAAELRALREQIEHQRARSAEIGAVAFLTTELDRDFHAAVVHASRNALLIRLVCDDLGSLVDLCRRQQRHMPDRANRALTEHARIVEALEERDPDYAELMMRRHIAAARRGLVGDVDAPDGSQDGRKRRRSRPADKPREAAREEAT